MGYNVFVTREIPKEGLEMARSAASRFDLNPEDRVLTRAELLAAVRGRDGVLCLLTDTIDGEVMEAARGVRIFANYAVGFNNIDVPEATRRGIMITNTPGVLNEATADQAWALLFAAARRVVEGDFVVRAGKFKGWGPMMLLGADVTGRTLGVVGAGRIGTEMAMRSKGFSMQVLYTDPIRNERLDRELGARQVPFDELLSSSDFVSLHPPLTAESKHLIGERELGLMKRGAILINTSRGPVVDEAALVRALRDRRIAGAGLDVYEREPELAPGLTELPNAVLAPHTASATLATRTKMATMAAENLIAGLMGKRPPHIVNPEVLKP